MSGFMTQTSCTRTLVTSLPVSRLCLCRFMLSFMLKLESSVKLRRNDRRDFFASGESRWKTVPTSFFFLFLLAAFLEVLAALLPDPAAAASPTAAAALLPIGGPSNLAPSNDSPKKAAAPDGRECACCGDKPGGRVLLSLSGGGVESKRFSSLPAREIEGEEEEEPPPFLCFFCFFLNLSDFPGNAEPGGKPSSPPLAPSKLEAATKAPITFCQS